MPRRHLAAAALLAATAACAWLRPPPPPAPAPRLDGHQVALEAVEAARGLRAAGDRERARRELGRAVAADPAWDLPRLDLAELVLHDDGDAAAARTLLSDEALRPDNPRLPRLRGAAEEQGGDLEMAAYRYGEALALADDPDLRLHRGLLLCELGRREEAMEELERVRAARPLEPLARQRLAELYEGAGRRAEALAELRFLAAAAPADPGPQRRLARFLRRAGEPERAAAAEKAARALERRTPRALRPLRPDGTRRPARASAGEPEPR